MADLIAVTAFGIGRVTRFLAFFGHVTFLTDMELAESYRTCTNLSLTRSYDKHFRRNWDSLWQSGQLQKVNDCTIRLMLGRHTFVAAFALYSFSGARFGAFAGVVPGLPVSPSAKSSEMNGR